jgi:putative flippase GtrA
MAQRPEAAEVRREFSWFAAVGTIGFAVDAALFVLLNGWYSWSIAAARTASASCSITTTWALNRRFTFAAHRTPSWGSELARYAFVQAAGLIVNIGVFALAVWLVPALRATPIIALSLGAGAALLFNFASVRALVIRGWDER